MSYLQQCHHELSKHDLLRKPQLLKPSNIFFKNFQKNELNTIIRKKEYFQRKPTMRCKIEKETVFVTNSDFLIPYLCNPMSQIFDISYTKNLVRSNKDLHIKCLHYHVAKIQGLENLSLWLELSSLINMFKLNIFIALLVK